MADLHGTIYYPRLTIGTDLSANFFDCVLSDDIKTKTKTFSCYVRPVGNELVKQISVDVTGLLPPATGKLVAVDFQELFKQIAPEVEKILADKTKPWLTLKQMTEVARG